MLTSFWDDTWVGHAPLCVNFIGHIPFRKEKKRGKSMGDGLTGG